MIKIIENILLMVWFIYCFTKLKETISIIYKERKSVCYRKLKLLYIIDLILYASVFILGFVYFVQGRII